MALIMIVFWLVSLTLARQYALYNKGTRVPSSSVVVMASREKRDGQ